MTSTHNTSTNTDPKKFPTTTSEVAKMLGISNSSHDIPMGTFSAGHGAPVANLPVVEDTHNSTHTNNHGNHVELGDLHTTEDTLGENHSGSSKALAVVKTVAPYVAVFSVGLLVYYFFFTNVNFGSIFNSTTPKAVTTKQTVTQELYSKNSASYLKWINSYYFDVTDSKILDPESDNSGNGLTNFQKYLLKLNPKSYDTLGLGKPDSEVLAAGIDPATGINLTDTQKDILAKYIDMEVVMNRLTLHKLQHPETVAGIGINSNGVVTNNPFITNQNTKNVAPNTGVDIVSSGIEINTSIPGRLEVPSLKINAPIIFTTDTNNFDKDLQSGVVHYPGTALPGEIGTTYIAGHSSNYLWSKGDYNQVFTKLGDLADNTSFKVTVVQKNGKNAIFHYVVTYRNQYLATDQEQFRNLGKSLVALSTCWPINTTAKRLVVFGELTQVEK